MRFCDEHGVALAPHGKTTMAPQLFADQLAAGAWGITAATVGQAQVMAHFGVERILLANQVVDPRAIRWLAESEPEVLCLVDSVAGVEALDAAGAARPIQVLVEIGVAERRGGLRGTDAALRVLEAAARASHVEPVGVECFEGVVGDRPAVEELLERVAALAVAGRERGLLPDPVLLSAGGSIFFDAAAGLRAISDHVVLRSGCYLTHDDGIYEAASPLGRTHGASDPLLPALELWTDVLSCPEPGRAIARRRAPRRSVRRRPADRPARLPRRRAGAARRRGGDRAQRPARLRDRRRAGGGRPAVPRHLPPLRRVRPLAHAARGRRGLHRHPRDPHVLLRGSRG